jgi:GT2 family glycosyltransferase/2-polyprenyl-3-methyl-5-hydroxy-6-metoxy-1,4-benzoquinol methylase/prefoldin subunit 5
MAVYDYKIDPSDPNSSHAKILRMVGLEKDVLEVGCATGYLTRHMKEKLGCRVVAVEMDQDAAEMAKAYCEELIVGDIEQVPLEEHLKGRSFDVVLLADILEHLRDARRLLDALREYLNPDGYMILSVPNGAHGAIGLELLDGNWRYRKEGLLDHTHLHFFDKDSLLRIIESTGLFVSEFDRVLIHPRDTELKIPWDSYPREVTAYLEKVNPEYQTYQFVLKVYPATLAGWKKGLADSLAFERKRASELERKNQTAEEALSRLQDQYDRLEEDINARFKGEMDRLEAEMGSIHKEYQEKITAMESETDAVHQGYKQKIADLEREVDGLHQHYNAVLNEKELGYKDEIEKLIGRLVGVKDEAIKKDKQVQVLQNTTEALNEKLVDLSSSITTLRESNKTLLQESAFVKSVLDEMHNSVAWAMLKRYRLWIDRWLPLHSRRRRFYQLCVLAPKVWIREGGRSFFRKIGQRIVFFKRNDSIQSPEPVPVKQAFDPIEFPEHETVCVSIVIPVYNQVHYTYQCLKSLKGSSSVAFEVIVYDNASVDETVDMLNKISNIKVIKDQENRGFVAACNGGAKCARGEYVLLLNNDTRVSSGWLEALLEPFADPSVGAVGGKLIYPDGRLQEAGGIIWQDGSGWNYGNGDNPELPQYCYRKEVDYCSAACLVVLKRLWQDIGGFDKRYEPAYYEDTDLCFSIRKRGYKVVFQPDAHVLHYEGATAGTDVSQGFKRFQQINLDKFREKWGEVLSSAHFSGPGQLYLARERGPRMRALVVDHYVPTYDKDSGSLRMFRLLKILSDIGYKVCFWPENRVKSQPYTEKLQQMGVEVLYDDVKFIDYVKENGAYIDLVLLSRPHIAVQFVDAVKAFTRAKVIYDTVDLHYLRESRRAGLESDADKRKHIEAEASEWKEKELYLSRKADVVLVVSPIEKEILEKEEGLEGKISVVSNVHWIEGCRNGFNDRSGLMFIGGFVHQPNEDGIVWFVKSIFPKVLQELPEIHLTIVGSHPTPQVKALASKNITVTGYVPDVAPIFEKARVFICPLRYGAGVKGKVGQSLSYGLPVVTTAIGAEGIGLIDEKHALIAHGEDDFAKKTIRVYGEERLWKTLSENGRTLIAREFSPEVIKERLHIACRGSDCG